MPGSALPRHAAGVQAAAPSATRVCLIVNSLDVGGLEKVALDLIQGFRLEGLDTYLVCLNGPGTLFSQAKLDSGHVLVLRKRASRILGLSVDIALLMALRRFLQQQRIDIVHAHNLAPLVYGGLAAQFVRPRPVVVYSEHNQLYSATAAVRRRFRHYLRLADHVVAVSADLKRELEQKIMRGRPVDLIRNGIVCQVPGELARAQARAVLEADADDFVIGTVGVLSEQKGTVHLLEAAAQVLREEPRAKVVVIGDGPRRRFLMDESVRLGIDGRVGFLGYRADVLHLLAGVDLYVQPSLWEGLPLVLLEALAAGKPIVATNVGGNPEVVEDGVNGLLVPPADAAALARAIVGAMRDDEFRTRAAAANVAKFAGEFRADRMVTAHVGAYTRFLRQRARA